MHLGFAPIIAAAPAAGPAAPLVVGAALVPLAFKAFSGLWTKDECKVEYDAARQQFYDFEAGLLNVNPETSWSAWKANGTLTWERGQWILGQMTQALNQFQSYTAQARAGCDPDWIDPRFHDYYDFFTGVVNNLRRELAAMYPYRTGVSTLMQNAYTGIARLTDPVLSQSYFPQSGTLPPVNNAAGDPNNMLPPGQAAATPVSAQQGLLYAGLAALAGMFLFSRSR